MFEDPCLGSKSAREQRNDCIKDDQPNQDVLETHLFVSH